MAEVLFVGSRMDSLPPCHTNSVAVGMSWDVICLLSGMLVLLAQIYFLNQCNHVCLFFPLSWHIGVSILSYPFDFFSSLVCRFVLIFAEIGLTVCDR